jgi:carboxyl-terminal processing protease
MKQSRLFLTLLTGFALLGSPYLTRAQQDTSESTDAGPDPGQISISVGRLLEQGHYSKHKLDEGVAKKFLANYLDALDFNHLFFTQKDVDTFNDKYGTSIGDDILLGNPAPAFDIYDTYKKRVEDRIGEVKRDIATANFDFTNNDSIEINRSKAPWPKDGADADRLWHLRLKGEFLQEKLTEHPIDPPQKVLTRRYDQLLLNLQEETKEDVIRDFLTTLAQTYDPHSEYLSKSDLENFSINMRLSLVGIGAVLRSEDGYAKIAELVPGGPAERSGNIKVNDRISAVAQGDSQFVDCVGMKLDKVVDMIRGKKGTTVRLQVIPARTTDPSQRKIVAISRDEIKLKESAAKADLIEEPSPSGGPPVKIGWITLPSFYADMEHSGEAGAKSTTTDVLALLTRLKAEGITGLVMDLRRNGGGSLDEAVKLTGLFINKGPVVQAKDANGVVHISRDHDSGIEWDGPMIVLTNRLSASASEIFAAALQDYGRAIIVGDQSTFGKGTVQTMLEIGKYIPFLGSDSTDAGALKLTIQKFYRIAGGSTQLKGVLADIHVPSPYDRPDFGESDLKGPMPYDEVEPADYDKWTHPLYIKELRSRSTARVDDSREFKWIEDDLTLTKQKIADNKISLNEKDRRQEIADAKTKDDKRVADRAKEHKPDEKDFLVTLDNVDKPNLEQVSFDTPKDGKDAKTSGTDSSEDDEDAMDDEFGSGNDKPDLTDPVRNEALHIITDFVEMNKTPKTTAANTAPSPADPTVTTVQTVKQ